VVLGHFCAETRDEARTALVALADASVFFAGAFVDADLVDRDRTDDDEVRGEGDALREGLVLPDECPLCAISAGACHVKNAQNSSNTKRWILIMALSLCAMWIVSEVIRTNSCIRTI